MKYGTVKFFDIRRGSGRIAMEGDTSEVYVDRSAIEHAGIGQIVAGQRLGFDVETGERGPRAVNLWATWSNR
jgi:CspA family cold shock protein